MEVEGLITCSGCKSTHVPCQDPEEQARLCAGDALQAVASESMPGARALPEERNEFRYIHIYKHIYKLCIIKDGLSCGTTWCFPKGFMRFSD